MQSSKYQYLFTHFGDKLKDALIKDHYKINFDTNNISNQNEYLKSGIDELLKADPKKGKFIQAIIRWYVNHEFKLEDVHRLNEDLTFFNRVKSKIENKDLLTYDTLKSVYDAIRPFQENENDSKSNKELMREAKAGAKKLYQEPGMIILELETEEAAKLYGKGTRWCTAADNNNMFKHYHDQGALYVIIANDPNGVMRKFQCHYETEQMMDEDDSSVNLENTPEIIQWLEKYKSYEEFCQMLFYKHNKALADKYYELLNAGKINPDGTIREPEKVNE
jgi:hypothetical protein